MASDPSSAESYDAAQGAGIDAVTVGLAEQARAWSRRLSLCSDLLARAGTSPRGNDRRFLPMELAGSWRVSQLTATRWLMEAERFTTALPQTFALLEQGALFAHQAQVLLQRTKHCGEDVARAVEAEVLPAAPGLCPADLGKRVDRAVLRLESEQASAQQAEDRHARAAAGRRVFSRPEPDGMALAGALLTAEQQVAWSSAMDALERRERIADRDTGAERTSDQRRADLFAALPAMVLAGTEQDATGAPRPWTLGPEQLAATVVLDIHIPVSTVLDLSREPATLDRYGPISAEHARLLRPRAYRRVLVDADSGRPIAVDDRTTPVDPDPQQARQQVQDMLRPAVVIDTDEPQHDPSARLARLIDVRDVHCAGPGCSATRTHRDHLEPHPAGATSARNLGRLSPRCHAAKHTGWTLVRHPDGSTTWHSQLGRTYRRPGPHLPPPRTDLYADLPPLRNRRGPPAPAEDDETDEPPPF